MRHDVDDRVGLPPGLVIVAAVFRESAQIHGTALVEDGRPGGFTPVVNARPREAACHKVAFADRTPAVVRHAVRGDKGALPFTGVLAARHFCAGGFASKHGQRGMFPVETVILVGAVVDADDILHRGKARLKPSAVHGAGNRTRGVILANRFNHSREESRAFHRTLQPFFVAHGPHDNAGVITIALHHFRQIGWIGILRPGNRVVEVSVSQMPVFVHDEHSQFVAGVEQRRVGGIVRHAPRIATHGLELLDAPVIERVRDGDTNPRKILMNTHALKLHWLTVEEEALVRVKTDGPNAKPGVAGVHGHPVDYDKRLQAV